MLRSYKETKIAKINKKTSYANRKDDGLENLLVSLNEMSVTIYALLTPPF